MITSLTIMLGLGLTSARAADLFSIPVRTIDGESTTLKAYRGKALLVVNVASKCGYTPQYEGLESLYRKYKDRGLVVLGFPSNDFLHQEPGTNAEIKSFCTTKFGVSFPMFAKGVVAGQDRQALFAHLTEAAPEKGEVKWNFEKFVVSPEGKVTERFRSGVTPDAAELTRAVEAALPKK